MKFTYITVSDKVIKETLRWFIFDALEDDDAEPILAFYARKSGAKRDKEAEVAGCVVIELLETLMRAVDKQGPEKVLKTLERMMRDE